MIVSIIGICGFRIGWIYTYFAVHREWLVLFWSYPISWLLTAAVHLICYLVIAHKFPKEKDGTEDSSPVQSTVSG